MDVTTVPAGGAMVSGPASSTSATNSWPITMSRPRSSGGPVMGVMGPASCLVSSTMAGAWRTKCRSEPHIPHARVRTRTWPNAGEGSGTSSTRSWPDRRTAARIEGSLRRWARRALQVTRVGHQQLVPHRFLHDAPDVVHALVHPAPADGLRQLGVVRHAEARQPSTMTGFLLPAQAHLPLHHGEHVRRHAGVEPHP